MCEICKTGHKNGAGGWCCPHWGNTCGNCPEHGDYPHYPSKITKKMKEKMEKAEKEVERWRALGYPSGFFEDPPEEIF